MGGRDSRAKGISGGSMIIVCFVEANATAQAAPGFGATARRARSRSRLRDVEIWVSRLSNPPKTRSQPVRSRNRPSGPLSLRERVRVRADVEDADCDFCVIR